MWVGVCQRITSATRVPLWAYYLPTFNSCLSTGFHLPIFSKYLKTVSTNFTMCAEFMKLDVLLAVTVSTLINTVSKSQCRLTSSVKCVAAIGHIETLQNVVYGKLTKHVCMFLYKSGTEMSLKTEIYCITKLW